MTVKVGNYILCSLVRELRPNHKKRVFFFCKTPSKDATVEEEIPTGYEVMRAPKNGLPLIRKKLGPSEILC